MNSSIAKPWIAVTLVACLSLVVCQLFDFRLAAIVSKVTASCGFLLVAVTAGAFQNLGVNIRWFLAAAVPIVLVSLGASMWLTPHIAPYFLTPVRIYTVVISVMLIAAIGTRGAGGPLLIPIGALLFYVSDLSVAAGKFVAPGFPYYVWGLPFYYSGQVLLALSVAKAIARNNRQSGSSVR